MKGAPHVERECPGLPAEWINGWLAAVGTTVLDSELRLSWTMDPSPQQRTSNCRGRGLAGQPAPR